MNIKILSMLLYMLLTISSMKAFSQVQHMNGGSIATRWAQSINVNNPLPEYPRPVMVRPGWTNLNGIWKYAITDSSLKFPNNYDGEILVPYPVESALSHVKRSLLPSQNLWYRTDIKKPKLQPSEKLLLHFGAVDWKATVFVNGKVAGSHSGGYTAFSFDISTLLKDGDNELMVKVYDPTNEGVGPHGKQTLNPANIYYTPSSGIWQTVWLETVPAVYISGLTITPNIDNSTVKIIIRAADTKPVTLKIEGKTIKGMSNTAITIPIKDPTLWTPDNPHLYEFTAELGKDVIKSYFGMRKISIQKDSKGIDRIFLNNMYTYNLGTLDQGFWPDGLYTAPTDDALKFDIQAAKAMGFNTIRKHIKVEPARWYHHADKLGMMVWQDLVNPNQQLPEGSKAAFESESKEIVEQLHNYPSITTWVLFNEKWGQYDQARLTKWLKEEDPSRIVNGHSGEYLYVNKELRSPSPNAYVNADMTDVHAYPSPMISLKQEGKAQVLGEFGGIGVPIEGHLWDDLTIGWGYDGMVTPKKMKDQYKAMIDTLVQFKKQGLSGSIYTQPFDVESEQNGLITYDREIIKIPMDTLRTIHAKLWPITKNYKTAIDGIIINAASENGSKNYADRQKAYAEGIHDSASLRSLAIMALSREDKILSNRVANDYIKQIKSPLSVQNLKFIQKFTNSTTDPGFELLFKNRTEINTCYGSDYIDNTLKFAVFNSEIKQYVDVPNANPNWKTIEKNVIGKYGSVGEPILLKAKLIHELNNKDFKNFVSTVNRILEKYPQDLSDNDLNNYAWAVFENLNDQASLNSAVLWCKKAIDNQAQSATIDTYANLLYKLGRKKKAIKWEKKAVEMDPDNQDIKGNFEKMKKGENTWPLRQ